jgi:predicted ABC-class ATPase
MADANDLRHELDRIDGRGYKAYRDIKGTWAFPRWELEVAWVQGDPYASPSRLRVQLPADRADLPEAAVASPSRRVGTAACLARTFAREAREVASGRGSGSSGSIRMESPGQTVLPQTAVQIQDDGSLDARFYAGLPARGRRVLGDQAVELLTGDVAGLVEDLLLPGVRDEEALVESARVNEEADHLRECLHNRGLVAFVADGSVLPRRSGIDDRPLGEAHDPGVVPFDSPTSLRTELELPGGGTVTGMAIPRGVTLLVGGGFHGKSTLLGALAAGVWNHCPGDGRERVVAEPDAVRIRAEEGRSVAGVDIRPYIDGLPLETDTRSFTTPDASGSTSQAAALAEALESGATTLLVDEDTAATNFMIRDRRMQALVPDEDEPITPFVDRVRELWERHEVSSVLVLGGSGDYLDVADTVLALRSYRPYDVTERAAEVARTHPTGRTPTSGPDLEPPAPRVPDPASVNPRKGRRPVNLKVRERHRLVFGTETVDLSAVEPLVSRAQTRSVGRALALARTRLMDGSAPVAWILDRIEEEVELHGLDVLDPRLPGDLAAVRRHEIAAALNRLRTLRVESSRG